jgi:hypothetical protein
MVVLVILARILNRVVPWTSQFRWYILVRLACKKQAQFLLGSIALGGEDSFGSAALTSMKPLATDVRGGMVPCYFITFQTLDDLIYFLFSS